MAESETLNLLKNKVLKIFGFLFLIRLGLYIPVPNVDLDIFSQTEGTNPLFGIAKNLTGSSFLSVGSLGILPYINSSIVIQLLTPIIPNLTRLQRRGGIRKATNYQVYKVFNVWLGYRVKHSNCILFCKTCSV